MTTRTQAIDLNTIINFMVLMMVMGMMMKMMTSAIKEPAGLLYKGAAPPRYRPPRVGAAPPIRLREEEFYRPPPPIFTSVPETTQEWRRLGDCITASGAYAGTEDVADLVTKTDQPIYEWYSVAERSVALAERREAKNILLWWGEKAGCYKEHHSSPGRYGEPKSEEERAEEHERLYGTRETPERGRLFEHHSIHGPERQHLVDLYGSWAVGRAESVCPEGDVPCVEREASRLLGAYRRAYTE